MRNALLIHTRRLLLFGLITCSGICYGNDFVRQLDPNALNEMLIGEQVHYTYTVDAQIPLPVGVSWIFAGQGKGELSFSAAHRIAEAIAAKGWHTVIISPSWLQTELPAVPAGGEEEMASSTQSLQPWQSVNKTHIDFPGAREQLRLVLRQVALQTQDKMGFRLFIAEGMTATLLLALGEEADLPVPDALAVVSPFWPDSDINHSLSQLTASYPYPILDIAHKSANNWSRSTDSKRLIQANVQIKMHYRQRQLPRLMGLQASDWLSGEIVGWTRSLGW